MNPAQPYDLERLRQFFGACFHQDWDLDAPDADGIVDRFIADSQDRSAVLELARQIEAYCDREPDDRELEARLHAELWCEYIPSGAGPSVRDWLLRVAARLRASAVA